MLGGLHREDWTHWGEFTTFKANAPLLAARELRASQTIYCSPLTDPYQPAEAQQALMPDILRAIIGSPPRVFVIQTRSPLILRDLDLLAAAAGVTCLRVSFSITTDQDEVRRIFEPHCAPLDERWKTVAALRAAGIETVATLAPLLPCNPEALIERALLATAGPVVADPLHVRAAKPHGAQTRNPAHAICDRHGWEQWLDPVFQERLLFKMRAAAGAKGRQFGWGPPGFSVLAVSPGTENRPAESLNSAAL